MSEKMIMLLFNVFILLIILVMQILTTRISRKNILLGVKIPEEKMETDEVKKIVKGFIRENIIVGVPALILISTLLYYIDNINNFVLSPFLYLGILFLLYMRWNKKTQELKKEKAWDKLSGKVLVIDTKFSRDRGKTSTISRKWFLIPLGIILISTILSLIMYPSLSDKVPTHWDIQGNIDGYMNKSIIVALLMPITQLFLAMVIYISYYFMIKSKQQINPKNPELSLKKNLIFRKIWSIYFIVTLTVMEILFTVLNMASLGLLSNMRIINFLSLIIYGIIILGSVILSIVIGQGGDRIKLDDDKELDEGYDIDDDNLWKFANSIYYNPNDLSIFIEKRVGSGWTVNAGRPVGMALMTLPFIIIILTLFFIK